MKADRPSLAILALVIGALVLFVGGGARFSISLTLQHIDTEFASGRSLVGVAVLTFQVVSAVAMLYAGRLSDRYDLRLVLGTGALIAAAGLGAVAFVSTPLQLVVFYGVVFGLGTGIASLIPIGVLMTRAFPDRIGMANAVVIMGMGLGQLVVIAVFTAYLADLGWRKIYLVLGLMHIALVALIFVGIGRKAAVASDRSQSVAEVAKPQVSEGLDLIDAARTGRFWVLLAVYAICGFHDFFVSTHIVAFVQDRGGSASLAGNLLALMGLMMLLGVMASGWASDKRGPVLPTLVAFILRIGLFALVLWDQSTSSAAIFALLCGMTLLVTAPLCVVFTRNAFGMRNLGLISGLITMVHHIAGGFGAWLGAVWFDLSGNYDAILFVMLATSIAGTALTLLLRSERC
ncbi:MAG: MFS transporter [Hyphomicrobiaceae bacterium]